MTTGVGLSCLVATVHVVGGDEDFSCFSSGMALISFFSSRGKGGGGGTFIGLDVI